MISLELWRARIGGWGSRKNLSSESSSTPPTNCSTSHFFCDALRGITICLLASVITILLVIGGIEMNPGPPKKIIVEDPSQEKNLPITLPSSDMCDKVFHFQEHSDIVSKVPRNFNLVRLSVLRNSLQVNIYNRPTLLITRVLHKDR